MYLSLLDQATLLNAFIHNQLSSAVAHAKILCSAASADVGACALNAAQYSTTATLDPTSVYYLLLTNIGVEREITVVFSPGNAGDKGSATSCLHCFCTVALAVCSCIAASLKPNMAIANCQLHLHTKTHRHARLFISLLLQDSAPLQSRPHPQMVL